MIYYSVSGKVITGFACGVSLFIIVGILILSIVILANVINNRKSKEKQLTFNDKMPTSPVCKLQT